MIKESSSGEGGGGVLLYIQIQVFCFLVPFKQSTKTITDGGIDNRCDLLTLSCHPRHPLFAPLFTPLSFLLFSGLLRLI